MSMRDARPDLSRPSILNELGCSFCDNVRCGNRMCRRNNGLEVQVREGVLYPIAKARLTKIEASTTLTPSAPLRSKSGSTTPKSAPTGDIAAVDVGWKIVTIACREAAMMSSSVSASPMGPVLFCTNPMNGCACANWRENLTACSMTCWSKVVAKKFGSMLGNAKGSVLLSVTEPPA